MKSLAERHADRAQRKADNMTESDLNGSTGGIGNAMDAINAANEAIRSLSPEQRAELEGSLRDGFEAGEHDDRDGFEMAGIGVVNPFTTSLGRQMELADTDAQRGILPEPSFDPANGNINGAALEQAGNGGGAGNGWGSGGNADDDDEDGPVALRANMTVAEIEAIAADEEVDLDGATNNDQRIAKIEEARAAKLKA